MRLTFILLTAAFLQVAAKGTAQPVTYSVKNARLEAVLVQIEKQTGYVFFYSSTDMERTKPVTITLSQTPVQEAIKKIMANQPLSYVIKGNTVFIKTVKTEVSQQAAPPPEITVSGTVTDKSGKPLAAVSVTVPGTPFGTSTDLKGQYSLAHVPEKAKLVFTSVGFEQLTVDINGRTSIDVVLTPEIQKLDETVVIGYGTTTRRTSTASISSVTAEEISKQPIANPLNALQGRVAGALITQSNGLPGSRVTIQIRGINSIDVTSSGTQPLYIVDGVPFNMYNNSVPVTNDLNSQGHSSAAGGLSPFGLINPADIDRIDILKDADATAIYGTRGSNGVVLITTKKGKAGKTKLDLNVYQGQGKVGHFIPLMSLDQYLQMRKEAYANDGITPTAANAPDLFLWDQNKSTDWQEKYLGGTAGITDAQATVSGGDTRTRFLLNAGYRRETPVFPGDYRSQRISTRLNVDHNSADKKFNANVSVNYSFDNTNLLGQDLSSLYNLSPNMPLYNPDGSLYWNANFVNPESYLLVKYIGKTSNLMTNTVLRYTILPGLDLKTSFGFNQVQLEQNTQDPAISKSPFLGAQTNTARFSNSGQRSYILEPQATYTRDVFEGRLTALLGSTFQQALSTATRIAGSGYSTPELLGSIIGAGAVGGSINLSTGSVQGNPGYDYTLYKYNSIFGRLTYEWASKYLLNAVLRRDGSTRFGADKRFGTFWSVGAGWVFSKENFANSLSFFSFGKLRASYGLTGNDQIQDYQYRAFFTSAGTYQNSATLAPNRIDNPLLHWQNTYKLEFGLDMSFLDNKIDLTTNYYRNRTPDQLGFLSLSSQAGFNSYAANFDAHIQNSGWEFELNTNNITGKDFRWTTSFNLTIPQTKLLSASSSYFYYNKSVIGKPLSVEFRYLYQGVDAATGKPLFKNFTKDSLTFTPNFNSDRTVIGYTAPKLYGGLNNVLAYKNLEMSFFFQFQQQEGSIYPNPPTQDPTPGVLSNGNQPQFWLNRWTKQNQGSSLPAYTTSSFSYSNWFRSSANWGNTSFIRLRTVNVSYAFPQPVIKRLKIENLRLYVAGQNLWWTSKNKYVYDPETGTNMPPLRLLTAGINVTL